MRAPYIVAPTIAFVVLISTLLWAEFTEPDIQNIEPLACVGSQDLTMCYQGSITRIIDGDTLDIDDMTIRLSLVDTPERNQDGYEQATAYLERLCPIGSLAFVDVDDGQPKDIYHRIIASVSCTSDATYNVGAELVKSGNAKIYFKFCNVSEFPAAWIGSRNESARWAYDACN